MDTITLIGMILSLLAVFTADTLQKRRRFINKGK